MPELIKLYIRSAIFGSGLSTVFVALLLWFDVANLGNLVLSSDSAGVAIVALWVSNAVVFGGVQFGIAIMNMANRAVPPRGGLGAPLRPALVPALVPAKAPRRKTSQRPDARRML